MLKQHTINKIRQNKNKQHKKKAPKQQSKQSILSTSQHHIATTKHANITSSNNNNGDNTNKCAIFPILRHQKRFFRGVCDEPGAVELLTAVFPETAWTRAQRVFARVMQEREDVKRWDELTEADPSFNVDYAIEVYKILIEQFEEKQSLYHYKIYTTSQRSYDLKHTPAQHYFHAKVAQGHVLNECFDYLDDSGLMIPWEEGQLRVIAERMPREHFLMPIPEIFFFETQNLIHKHSTTVRLNETDEDKQFAGKIRELRELVRTHDANFLNYAFTIDENRAKSGLLNVDTSRRILQRFNSVFDQHNVHSRIEQQLKKEIDPLGSFLEEEVDSWQLDRLDVVLNVLSTYFVKILNDEFKMKTPDAYYIAQHSIHSHLYDSQISELLQKHIYGIGYFLQVPDDNEETAAMMEKEQARRRQILQTPEIATDQQQQQSQFEDDDGEEGQVQHKHQEQEQQQQQSKTKQKDKQQQQQQQEEVEDEYNNDQIDYLDKQPSQKIELPSPPPQPPQKKATFNPFVSTKKGRK